MNLKTDEQLAAAIGYSDGLVGRIGLPKLYRWWGPEAVAAYHNAWLLGSLTLVRKRLRAHHNSIWYPERRAA